MQEFGAGGWRDPRCGRIVRPGGDRGVAEHGVDVGGAGEDRGAERRSATPPRKDGSIVRGAVRGEKGWRDDSQGGRGDRGDGIRTETCPKVDKLFGPGNQFDRGEDGLQNRAAMVSIDMPLTGEVLVIADKDARRRTSPPISCPRPNTVRYSSRLVTFPDVDLKAITKSVAEQAATTYARHHRQGAGHSYAVVVTTWPPRAILATVTLPST